MWGHKWEICYNCDEKFTQGHICDEKNFYLLDLDSPHALEFFQDAKDIKFKHNRTRKKEQLLQHMHADLYINECQNICAKVWNSNSLSLTQ